MSRWLKFILKISFIFVNIYSCKVIDFLYVSLMHVYVSSHFFLYNVKTVPIFVDILSFVILRSCIDR